MSQTMSRNPPGRLFPAAELSGPRPTFTGTSTRPPDHFEPGGSLESILAGLVAARRGAVSGLAGAGVPARGTAPPLCCVGLGLAAAAPGWRGCWMVTGWFPGPMARLPDDRRIDPETGRALLRLAHSAHALCQILLRHNETPARAATSSPSSRRARRC